MRKRRRICAEVLRDALDAARAGGLADAYWEGGTKAEQIRAVLDEFELMGFLVRRKVIDAQAVWTLFGYWLVNYHAYCSKVGFLGWERDSSTIYEEFVTLCLAVQAIAKERDGEEDEPDEGFIHDELFLTT
jgi:hypothetical protein